MKSSLPSQFRPAAFRLLVAAAAISATTSALAGLTDLSSVPMQTSVTSKVRPNLLYTLDDSGSMGSDYLPDYVDDSGNSGSSNPGHCRSGNPGSGPSLTNCRAGTRRTTPRNSTASTTTRRPRIGRRSSGTARPTRPRPARSRTTGSRCRPTRSRMRGTSSTSRRTRRTSSIAPRAGATPASGTAPTPPTRSSSGRAPPRPSFTAMQANKLLARTGEFWHREYYDHLVRDADDFARIADYIRQNPQKAGLKNWPWIYPP